MATEAVKAGNVTKYDAGGSGDNVIANGQIKAVEKVWLDNYTLTSAVVLTNTTISLANLPVGAVITGIDISVDTSASQTSGSISLGFASDADGAAFGTLVAQTNVTHNKTTSTIHVPGISMLGNLNAASIPAKHAAFQWEVVGTQSTIALKLNNWTMTTGTVKSVVRYTSR